MGTMASIQVVEMSRHDSVNGFVYEYDESLASVKDIQRTHQQRIDWWRTELDAEASAGSDLDRAALALAS
ncbi:MAG: hypothetical protein JWO21_924 [Solirubrobacterales bacterium]|jgi:hypothetical protein|nr:hypothetical protein [Solirubrobacterales bacterium]